MGFPSVVVGNAKNAIIAFNTYERVEERTLVVVKKDGTAGNFLAIKFFNGINPLSSKRPVSSEGEIEEICKPDRAKKVQSKMIINSEYILVPGHG